MAQDPVQAIGQVPLDDAPVNQKNTSSVVIDGEDDGELAAKEWASLSSRRQ